MKELYVPKAGDLVAALSGIDGQLRVFIVLSIWDCIDVDTCRRGLLKNDCAKLRIETINQSGDMLDGCCPRGIKKIS